MRFFGLRMKMNERYLCYQQVVIKEDAGNIEIDVFIRNVLAKNKEEAIGKFILETKSIKAKKRLDVFCFPISELKSID